MLRHKQKGCLASRRAAGRPREGAFADQGGTGGQCSLGTSGHRRSYTGPAQLGGSLEMPVTSSAQDTVSAWALKVSLLTLPKRQRGLNDDLRVLGPTKIGKKLLLAIPYW